VSSDHDQIRLQLADAIRRYVPSGFRDDDGVWHHGPHQNDALFALDSLVAALEQAEQERDDRFTQADLDFFSANADDYAARAWKAEEKLAKANELARAVRTGLTWLARPSDLPAQHADTLIRATNEMREALAAWEAE
jgi:hypothetical protein